jgi:predicted component of type VI protein secretion system
MNPDCLNIVQCANVRPLGNAQSHITPDDRTLPRTIAAHCEQSPCTLENYNGQPASLKALAGAVLGASSQRANVRTPRSAQPHNAGEQRTLPRTLSAQSVEKDRTLPPHSDAVPHIADESELIDLVRLCGEHYGFTETEHAEALAAAAADHDSALLCYRSIASELND